MQNSNEPEMTAEQVERRLAGATATVDDAGVRVIHPGDPDHPGEQVKRAQGLGHAADGVMSDADTALAVAVSVAVPTLIMGEALALAPGMIDHLQRQGFDVIRVAHTPDPVR